MHNKSKLLLIGKVVGVHGIHGEIKILPYGTCEKKPWRKLYLSKEDHTVICEVLANRPHKGVILASLEGYGDRSRAGELVGSDVYVDRASLAAPPEGEYYHFQLQGMEVVTDNGETVGVITHIFSTGSNDVYVVQGPSGEILIPATSDVILKVDVHNRKMIIHMLEGIFEEDR